MKEIKTKVLKSPDRQNLIYSVVQLHYKPGKFYWSESGIVKNNTECYWELKFPN